MRIQFHSNGDTVTMDLVNHCGVTKETLGPDDPAPFGIDGTAAEFARELADRGLLDRRSVNDYVTQQRELCLA